MKSTKLQDVTFKNSAKNMGINLDEGKVQEQKPEYHYGLRICLNEDMIKMMGFKELPEVGEVLKMQALVEVCCKSEYESKESGEIRTLDLQITEMEIEQKKKTDIAKALYDKNVVEEKED